jgi:hypothetical protein
MVPTMAKMARVARRENLAKIGIRSFLNNFVVLYEQYLPKKRRAQVVIWSYAFGVIWSTNNNIT